MISKLKQQEKELQEKIKAWKDYESSKKKYYNIPLPPELDYSYINKIVVYEHNIDECKVKLDFLKIVSEFYDSYDFVVDIDYFTGFCEEDSIKDIHITADVRKKLHKIIENLERDIKKIEEMKNN